VGLIWIDTETTGLDPYCDTVCTGIGWVVGSGEVGFIDPRTCDTHADEYRSTMHSVGDHLVPPLPPEYPTDQFQGLLTASTPVYYNAQFDIQILECSGFKHPPQFHDVMIMAKVVEPGNMNYGLKVIAKKYLGDKAVEELDEIKAWLKKANKGVWERWIAKELDNLIKVACPHCGVMPLRSCHGGVMQKEHPGRMKEGCPRCGAKGEEPCYKVVGKGIHKKREELALLKKVYLRPPPRLQVQGDAPYDLRERYCIKDVVLTAKLFWMFWTALKGSPTLMRAYGSEMEAIYPLIDMQRVGLKVDLDKVKVAGPLATKAMDKIERFVWMKVGEKFNLKSTKQIVKVMYGKGLADRYSKTGEPSADREALHRSKHPLSPYLLRYRDLSKFVNTYLHELAGFADEGGRIHGYFRSMGADATGRTSSDRPNLQNLSAGRRGRASQVRKYVIPTKGYNFVMLDWSQQEARVMAWLAQENTMLGIFRRKEDIHVESAKWLFETDKPQKWQRQIAKTANYLIQYGGQYDKLRSTYYKMTGNRVLLRHAKVWFDRYHRKFPGVKQYAALLVREVRRNKGVWTSFGRFLKVQPFMTHAAINYVVQGTCASILKRAVVRQWRYLGRLYGGVPVTQWPCRQVAVVHDEVIFEVKPSEMWVVPHLVECMGDNPEIGIPLPVDASWSSYSWGDKGPLQLQRVDRG